MHNVIGMRHADEGSWTRQFSQVVNKLLREAGSTRLDHRKKNFLETADNDLDSQFQSNVTRVHEAGVWTASVA